MGVKMAEFYQKKQRNDRAIVHPSVPELIV